MINENNQPGQQYGNWNWQVGPGVNPQITPTGNNQVGPGVNPQMGGVMPQQNYPAPGTNFPPASLQNRNAPIEEKKDPNGTIIENIVKSLRACGNFIGQGNGRIWSPSMFAMPTLVDLSGISNTFTDGQSSQFKILSEDRREDASADYYFADRTRRMWGLLQTIEISKNNAIRVLTRYLPGEDFITVSYLTGNSVRTTEVPLSSLDSTVQHNPPTVPPPSVSKFPQPDKSNLVQATGALIDMINKQIFSKGGFYNHMWMPSSPLQRLEEYEGSSIETANFNNVAFLANLESQKKLPCYYVNSKTGTWAVAMQVSNSSGTVAPALVYYTKKNNHVRMFFLFGNNEVYYASLNLFESSAPAIHHPPVTPVIQNNVPKNDLLPYNSNFMPQPIPPNYQIPTPQPNVVQPSVPPSTFNALIPANQYGQENPINVLLTRGSFLEVKGVSGTAVKIWSPNTFLPIYYNPMLIPVEPSVINGTTTIAGIPPSVENFIRDQQKNWYGDWYYSNWNQYGYEQQNFSMPFRFGWTVYLHKERLLVRCYENGRNTIVEFYNLRNQLSGPIFMTWIFLSSLLTYKPKPTSDFDDIGVIPLGGDNDPRAFSSSARVDPDALTEISDDEEDEDANDHPLKSASDSPEEKA